MSIVRRVAIVSGAAKGIGRAVALRLAKDGLDVAVNDLPAAREGLNVVADEIRQHGRKSWAVCADVSTEEGVRTVVSQSVEKLGGLDVMVANAGIGIFSPLLETSEGDWDRIMGINARGTMLQYKIAAEQMIKQGRGGRIIGASSMAGKRGFASLGGYVASKFAIRGLTQTASLEFGKFGITVNAYAPGFIKTDLTVTSLDAGRGPGVATKLGFGYTEDAPIGDGDDIAELVSYLAKKEAKFITGQTIIVDGGLNFD